MTHPMRYQTGERRIIGIIGDEDTVTGFILAGVGDNRLAIAQGSYRTSESDLKPNYLVVCPSTPLSDIESAFNSMCTRGDIGIIIITQNIANDIRHLIKEHTAVIPSIVEIPSKDQKYDPEKDLVLEKINRALGIR
ncbi:unnamed protein product [Phytomonas sp. Hart1]|nr:unnamed protein product [Phytomonas sp. Hart1]|eukprot:CCW70285.1 unnamed protein product [Phytomonas sp. isolate Hart1]